MKSAIGAINREANIRPCSKGAKQARPIWRQGKTSKRVTLHVQLHRRAGESTHKSLKGPRCTFAVHLCTYNRTNFWRVEIFFQSLVSIGRRPSYKSQREDARQKFSSLWPLFASCVWSLTTARQYLKSIRVILEPRSDQARATLLRSILVGSCLP